jgi:ATP-dependent Clp protease ATP-binding subunit ClpA
MCDGKEVTDKKGHPLPSFSRSLEQALHKALALAGESRHEYATLEHLLLSLIEDPDASAVMRACNVDLDMLRHSLNDYIKTELNGLVMPVREDAKPTAGFSRVIQRAVIHVQSSGREEVTGANVLIAIFAERESHAAFFLQQQDMTRYDAVNYTSHGIAKRPGASEPRIPRGAYEEQSERPAGDDAGAAKKKADALDAYCINLNLKAKDGKVDPLIGVLPKCSARFRFCAAARKTTRCLSVIPVLARLRLQKAWR